MTPRTSISENILDMLHATATGMKPPGRHALIKRGSTDVPPDPPSIRVERGVGSMLLSVEQQARLVQFLK